MCLSVRFHLDVKASVMHQLLFLFFKAALAQAWCACAVRPKTLTKLLLLSLQKAATHMTQPLCNVVLLCMLCFLSVLVLVFTGLDARAAAIVMRTVRNTVNTGRTVVCTIHQPSIDIFEASSSTPVSVPWSDLYLACPVLLLPSVLPTFCPSSNT